MMEKQNFKDLIKKAKASKETKTIQKVVPVALNQTEEVQFSFYLEKNLLKKLKQSALDKDLSIKAIINESIKNHLKIT